MREKRIIFALAAAVLLGTVSPALAMRCGSDLVSIGDSKGEVAAKCGEPYDSEIVAAETRGSTGEGVSWEVTVPVELWTYRQGRGTMIKILTFRGDRLERIEDGDRDHGPGAPRGTTFFPSTGATQTEILQRYGEPLRRDLVGIGRSAVAGEGVLEEKIEHWTYDLGPGRFLKILTFKGGRLVEVEDGDRR